MSDDELLRDCDVLGQLSPNSAEEREQCFRLIQEGYLKRIPVPAMPGDPNDPLLCELTDIGKTRVRGKS